MPRFYAPRKKFYEISTPQRIRALILESIIASLTLVSTIDHSDLFISDISIVGADSGEQSQQSLDAPDGPEHHSSTGYPATEVSWSTWGGTRIGQWLVIEQILEHLKESSRIDPGTEVLLEHGKRECVVFLSDHPNGHVSSRLIHTLAPILQELHSYITSATQGYYRIRPRREHPLFDSKQEALEPIVTRILRGDCIPLSFTLDEITRIVQADITRDGIIRNVYALHPALRENVEIEQTNSYLLTAKVKESKEIDVAAMCRWFEQVFPEFIQPGFDVIAQPRKQLDSPGVGF